MQTKEAASVRPVLRSPSCLSRYIGLELDSLASHPRGPFALAAAILPSVLPSSVLPVRCCCSVRCCGWCWTESAHSADTYCEYCTAASCTLHTSACPPTNRRSRGEERGACLGQGGRRSVNKKNADPDSDSDSTRKNSKQVREGGKSKTFFR